MERRKEGVKSKEKEGKKEGRNEGEVKEKKRIKE